jgi:ParB-like chromosome segregation protein Spo0J
MKLKPSEIKPNPNNPRLIKDDKFKKLVKSLKDFPEMAEVREVVINKDHVILGGNMRFKAMLEAGWIEIPVKVVDWSEDKQKQFIIKDNVSGGEWDWDVLANEWNADLLEEWGLSVPSWDDRITDNKEVNAEDLLGDNTIMCPKCNFEFEKK